MTKKTKTPTVIAKLSAPPKPTTSLTSVVLTTPEEVAAAYALIDHNKRPLTQEERRRVAADEAKMEAARQRVKKMNGAADETADEDDVNAARLTELSAVAARRKPETPTPGGAAHEALTKAKFVFISTAKPDRDGDPYVHGYQHPDGRIAAQVVTSDDHAPAKLKLVYPDGRSYEDAEAMRHLAMSAKERLAARRSEKRGAKMRERDEAKARKAVETGTDALSEIEARHANPQPTPEQVAGMPGNVIRAIEMLESVTARQYDLNLLRGDRYYGKRMALLKKLLQTDRVLAKECGINNLVSIFYTAVGAEGKSAAAKATNFAERCKDAMKRVRAARSAATRMEKKNIKRWLRATVIQRTVPGTILPGYKPLNKKQRAEQDAKDRDYVFALAATAEHYPIPKADAEVEMNLDEVRVLEDPANGIAFLQIERANSQGAICVYNNGSRVACGVVPTATLLKLRRVPQDVAQLGTAANQLLNPVNVSVPVTSVAQRHLTAVIESCKERQEAMAKETAANEAKTAKTAKFAPPAKKGAVSAKKAPAKTDKPAKKSAKSDTPRATSYAGKKIKVLNKNHGARQGTKRQIGMDIILGSKTTDEAMPKLIKAGCNNTFLAFAVSSGLVELV